MSTFRLTIDLRGVTDEPVGVAVQVEVPQDRAVPDSDDPGRQIVGGTLTRHTNIDGKAVFDLVPTEQLLGRSLYSVRWAGGNPYSFPMPARNISLYDIQGIPAPASPAQVSTYQQIDTDRFGIAAGSGQITVSAAQAGAPQFYEGRTFTAPPNGITSGITQETNGLRVTEDGIYSLDLQLAVEIESSSEGEWGVSLVRTNGLTGEHEDTYQSAVDSQHITSLTSGDEDYIKTVQFPVSQFNAGDFIYFNIAAVFGAAGALNFNLSPGTLVSFLEVRRYRAVIGTLAAPEAIVSTRSATAPTNPVQGNVWIDTSVSPPHERRWSGTAWEDILDPQNVAAALNSLEGNDRLQGRHIAWPLNPDQALTALPAVAGYQANDIIWAVDSAGGDTDPSLYYLHAATTRPRSDRNRFQFTITGGTYRVGGTAADNYQNALGEFQVDAGRGVIEVGLDAGLGIDWPNTLYVEGVGTTRLQLIFREAVPYTNYQGRRYKNYFIQTPIEPSGQTTLTLFTGASGANPYNFKPASEPVSPAWTAIGGSGGGGGGGGLSQSQVDTRVRALVENYAEVGNAASVPLSKLPTNIGEAQLASAVTDKLHTEGEIESVAQDQVADWAEEGNNTRMPASKLPSGVPTSAPTLAGLGGLTQSQVDGRVNAVIPANRRIPSGGSTGQVLKKTSGSNYAVGWAADNEGGGLSQSQVDARVNAVIPANRRIPSGGSTGQVLKKTSGSNYAVGWANDETGSGGGGGLTEAQVKAEIKPYAQADNASTLIATSDIANDAVTQAKIADNAVGNDQIANNAVQRAQIADDAINAAKITTAAVTASEIANGAVITDRIADQAVETRKIDQNAVTLDKLASAVTGRLIPSGGTDGQVLTKSADANYQVGWEDAPSGGGGGTAEFYLSTRPASASISIPSASSGDIGDWVDIISAAAITSGQTGRLLVKANFNINGGIANDNNHRTMVEVQLVKVSSGGAETVLSGQDIYLRKWSSGNAGFVAASNTARGFLADVELAAVGDVFKLQSRVSWQRTGTVTATAAQGDNILTLWRPPT